MSTAIKSALPVSTFLVDVVDPVSGVTIQTFGASQAPALLLALASSKFNEGASNYFKVNFDLGSVDWRLLFLVAREPGVTAAHAARSVGVDKGAVSRSLQRLESGGWLVAGDLHANGRSRGWHLTKSGRVLHKRILRAALDRQDQLLAGFEVEDVKTLCRYLERLTENLHRMSIDR